MAKQLKVLVI